MRKVHTTARGLARNSTGALAALPLVAPVAAIRRGDGDGMPAGWERRNGLNVQRNDELFDLWLDGAEEEDVGEGKYAAQEGGRER